MLKLVSGVAIGSLVLFGLAKYLENRADGVGRKYVFSLPDDFDIEACLKPDADPVDEQS